MPRWLKVSLLGCGGLLGLVVVLLIAAVILAGSPSGKRTAPEGEETQSEKQKASSKASNRNDIEATAGEPAEATDRTLVVNEAQRNYVPANPRVYRNQQGYEFVRVYLTLKNTGGRDFRYNVLDFKLQDSNGVQNPPKSVSDLPYPIHYGSLAPSGTLEGNIVFEVPQGDNRLKLIYQPSGPQQQRTMTVTL